MGLSLVVWIGLGIAVVVGVVVLLAIAFYPSDNSF
jgi:hypothetical protein